MNDILLRKDIKKAPFTQEEIDVLNEHQRNHEFHPYTCGGNRKDAKHLDGEGVLVATEDGWICPFCDYKQDWY